MHKIRINKLYKIVRVLKLVPNREDVWGNRGIAPPM